jgi:hypothetical protein
LQDVDHDGAGIYLILQTVNPNQFPGESSIEDEFFLTVHEQTNQEHTQMYDTLEFPPYDSQQNSSFVQVEDLPLSDPTEPSSNQVLASSFSQNTSSEETNPRPYNLLEKAHYRESLVTLSRITGQYREQDSFAYSWKRNPSTSKCTTLVSSPVILTDFPMGVGLCLPKNRITGVPLSSDKSTKPSDFGLCRESPQVSRHYSSIERSESESKSSQLIPLGSIPVTVSELMRRDLDIYSADQKIQEQNAFVEPIGIIKTNTEVHNWNIQKLPDNSTTIQPNTSTNAHASIKARIAMFEKRHTDSGAKYGRTGDKVAVVKLNKSMNGNSWHESKN